MANKVRCPKCATSYNIADNMAGKKIRCKKCQTIIVVPSAEEEEELEDEDEAEEKPKAGKVKQKSPPADEDDDDDESEPAEKKPKAGKSKQKSASAEDDEEDDADEKPRGKGKKAPAKKSSSTLLIVLGIGGLLLCLGGGGGAALIAMFVMSGPTKVAENKDRDKDPRPIDKNPRDLGKDDKPRDDKNKDKDKDGGLKEQGPIEVTADQLDTEYADLTSFLRKYSNRQITVSGTMRGFPYGTGALSIKHPSLHANLDKTGPKKGITFAVQDNQKSRLAELVWNQPVKIRGKLDQKALGQIQLADCEILEVGKPPAVFASLTSEQLFMELQADRLGTVKKYQGKILEITGPTGDMFYEEGYLKISFPWQDPMKKSLQFGWCSVRGKGMDDAYRLFWRQSAKVRGRFSEGSSWIAGGQFIEAGPDPSLKVTSIEYAKDVAADKKAAIAKYNQKALRVEGQVISISKQGQFGQYKAELAGWEEGKGKPIRMTAYINSGDKQVASVKAGQTIVVRGLMNMGEPASMSFGGILSVK